MKHIKKIGALVLAVVMIMAMSTTAFAAGDTYTGSGNDNADNFTGLSADPQTIPLTKGIVFFNANGSAVYEPNVTFKYVVAPDTSLAANGTTATVTDNQSPAVTRNVYPGPAGGVYGGTYSGGVDSGLNIAFSTANGTKTTDAAGAEVEESGNLTFNPTAFTKPGIYRYIITESVVGSGTDAENLAAAGLTARDADYTTTRYLDVYVKYVAVDDDNDPSTPDVYQLQMYGAVIFVSTESTPGTDSITTSTEKTTGFEPGVGGSSSYASDKNVDKYYTYDFTVKKTVSGSLADRNHEFPFYVTVSNSISGAKFTYTADSGESFTGATNTSGAVELTAADFSIGADSTSSSLTLKNNDTIVLVGLPSKQDTGSELAVVIKEFNNTYDQYTATVAAVSATDPTIAKTNNVDGSTGVMTASTGSIETASFAVKTNDIANQIITVDNNLTEISPTGYVVRIAPYVLMLAGGIALLVVTRRRREDAQAA